MVGSTHKKKKRREESVSTSESSDSSQERDHRRNQRKREKEKKRAKYEKRKKRHEENERERDRDSRRKKKGDKKRRSSSMKKRSNDSSSDSESSFDSSELVLSEMLTEFPNVGSELKQLLEMVDDGQAVDIKGISEKLLVQYLKRLFISLRLKESGDSVFILPTKARPTLELLGPLIHCHSTTKQQPHKSSTQTGASDGDHSKLMEDHNVRATSIDDIGPQRRVIGPAMPSAELLAAAAKLTDAQAELNDIELEEDNSLFIGPPPPAMVAESESANDAERFEEVTRILDSDSHSPYDIVGGNENMSPDSLKKRYWKLSLLVHPDKCSHPLAHQAFVKLNNAFKELQDPEKKKLLDDKIKAEKEQEQFKIELKAMREVALWRRSQGISMEGDDELLAGMEQEKEEKQRDEWMTTLPPERKPGVTTQSSRFSKNSVSGRGDTSIWTDTPSDRAQKAKTNYLEAYNEAAAIAGSEQRNNQRNEDAELVDQYNKTKRSKSLLQKHKEGSSSNSKKRAKKIQDNTEWAGQHPWKPWDREKDLSAGRLGVKLDSENMAQGLSSRFSSGNFQRNFL